LKITGLDNSASEVHGLSHEGVMVLLGQRCEANGTRLHGGAVTANGSSEWSKNYMTGTQQTITARCLKLQYCVNISGQYF